jgi:glyoxylase-like metal-dependent hydrolase (beta-lactamase superfamily II)
MTVSLNAIALNEMAIPAQDVFVNTNANSPIVKALKGVEDIKWSDGSIGKGIRHCGCVFLIIDGNKRILIDTGSGPFEKIKRTRDSYNHKYYFRELATIEEKLAGFSLTTKDIDIVINTHLHWDHIGGNELFSNATFFMPSKEITYALNPPKWAPHYFIEMKNCVLNVLDRTIFVESRKKITENVSVFCLGGHSPGCMCVIVKTDIGRIALAGDIVCKYVNWENRWIGPNGNIWNFTEAINAFDVLSLESDIVIPCHDWELFSRYADGKIC